MSGGSSEEEDSDSGDDVEDVVERIDYHLDRPWRLRARIGRVFRRFADGTSDAGAPAITSGGWGEMTVGGLAETLSLPEWLFSNASQLYERFDFDGDGLLEKYEVVKLVKYVLRQRRTELGGRAREICVPDSTLKQEGYTVSKELGRGGQGAMYLCSKTMSAHSYCVKFYNKKDANACGLQELIDEYALMKTLASEHIAQTYHVFQDSNFYYLVNEPYFGGDLTKLAKRANDKGMPMTEGWWRPIFRQCMEGLAYLHRKAIMHCDIKEPNIMIAMDDSYAAPRPVLIDFGLSSPFSKKEGGISGTPGYIPPETWERGHWYPLGDIFSMGITFFQLMIGQVPSSTGSVMGVLQPCADPAQLKAAGLNAQLPWHRFPAEMPELRDLVGRMTSRERSGRPRAPQCLEHDWFGSDSDAALPAATRRGLLGSSATSHGGELVVNQLMQDNNLDQLRRLRENADQKNQSSESSPLSRLKKLRGLLSKHDVRHDSEDTTRNRMMRFLDEAIRAKHSYSSHYVSDLFKQLDGDQNGRLSIEELSKLLDTEAFECPFHDIQELVNAMGPFDRDRCVSYERFQHVVLEDGRIARRSDIEGRGSCVIA